VLCFIWGSRSVERAAPLASVRTLPPCEPVPRHLCCPLQSRASSKRLPVTLRPASLLLITLSTSYDPLARCTARLQQSASTLHVLQLLMRPTNRSIHRQQAPHPSYADPITWLAMLGHHFPSANRHHAADFHTHFSTAGQEQDGGQRETARWRPSEAALRSAVEACSGNKGDLELLKGCLVSGLVGGQTRLVQHPCTVCSGGYASTVQAWLMALFPVVTGDRRTDAPLLAAVMVDAPPLAAVLIDAPPLAALLIDASLLATLLMSTRCIKAGAITCPASHTAARIQRRCSGRQGIARACSFAHAVWLTRRRQATPPPLLAVQFPNVAWLLEVDDDATLGAWRMPGARDSPKSGDVTKMEVCTGSYIGFSIQGTSLNWLYRGPWRLVEVEDDCDPAADLVKASIPPVCLLYKSLAGLCHVTTGQVEVPSLSNPLA
jgi:hypothetical protein